MTDAERRLFESECRRRILRGDGEAWRLLHDATFPAVLALLRRRLQGQGIEDAVQETWMIAVKRIREFDPERAAFASWMFGIAERIALNARRKRPSAAGHEELAQVAAPVTRDAAAEGAAGLEGALARLPDDYREVLLAKYVEHRSVAAIAAERRASAKSIESLLSRARAALREHVQRLLGASPWSGGGNDE